jgi:ABC-type nitrate/sulfonate/bicarbonate transport system permease component
MGASPADAAAAAVVSDSARFDGADILRRIARPLSSALAAFAVILVLWIGFIELFHIDPLVAKSPAAVFTYLFTSPDAAANRSLVGKGLGQTLSDAGLGFVAGLTAAMLVALVFVLSRSIEQSVLPIAVVIRSIPLVAMTPVITLIFGRATLGTTVISGIVVFFPALVTIAFGLRSASRQASDLCRAYGGGKWMIARKVMVPSALPAVFASARVGVPGALIGATLAEYLATGRGLGYAMLQDSNTFDYDHLWASVVVLTIASVLVYYTIASIEAVVLARFGPAPSRR